VKRLRLARDLVGFDGMLKQPRDLLAEAIRAYAVGAPPPSPLIERPLRLSLKSVLNKVIDGSTKFNRVMAEIVADTKAQKAEFMTGMAQGRARTLAELTQKFDPRTLRQAPFEGFWAKGAPDYAFDFAQYLGLGDACRERGLEGLLAIRTVRFVVGYTMSLIYSQVIQGRAPDFGDKYDLWHATLASTADVFVTGDAKVAEHLARIPGVEGFRVVKSLGELLAL